MDKERRRNILIYASFVAGYLIGWAVFVHLHEYLHVFGGMTQGCTLLEIETNMFIDGYVCNWCPGDANPYIVSYLPLILAIPMPIQMAISHITMPFKGWSIDNMLDRISYSRFVTLVFGVYYVWFVATIMNLIFATILGLIEGSLPKG